MPAHTHSPLTPVEPSGGLRRREALQVLAGAMAGATVPGLAAQHPVQAHLADHAAMAQARTNAEHAGAQPGFLDAHHLATLRSLAERIVPGAGTAKTAEFIDQLLAVDSQANQRAFLTALGIFEGRALELRRVPWVTLEPADQDRILRDVSAMESGIPPAPAWTPGSPIQTGIAPATPPRLTFRDHFDLLKGWIAGAYYSSEIGMRELGWTDNPFHAEFPGCTHPDGHR